MNDEEVGLTEELLIEMVATFADKEILPYRYSIDQTGELPQDLWEKMIAAGFLSLTVPKEYNGAGFDCNVAWRVIYELSKRSASVGCILEGHYKTVDQVVRFARPILKTKYLPQANFRVFGFGSTEPSGGTNIYNMRTNATKTATGWMLNGSKVMITNAGLAEIYCILAKTNTDEISCFLVDKEMSGFSFGDKEDLMGLRGCPVGTLFFDKLDLSKAHLVGELGEGLMIGDSAHYDARIYMGGLLAGAVKSALDSAVRYSLQRYSGKQPLAELFAIQEKITTSFIAYKNILLLTQEAVRLRQSKQPYAKEATMIKAYGSKAAFSSIDNCLQILGGYGYSREYPIEHILRDVRALQIMEGSYEKMMFEISDKVCEEYR